MQARKADHPARNAPGGRRLDCGRLVDPSWLEPLIIRAGLTLVVLTAAAYVDSWAYQASAGFALGVERLREGTSSPLSPEPRVYAEGESIGWIQVPRLGIEAVVAHGSDSRTLSRAVGHIPGTALPGDDGNVGLAGHRDTFFRALADIENGDLIHLTTPRRARTYRVVSVGIVSPNRIDVLDPAPVHSLTLVTCYPFEYIGAAPYRYVVRAAETTVPAAAGS